jgi:hypothetical protein
MTRGSDSSPGSFTLGAAAYIDARETDGDVQEYLRRAAGANAIILRSFGGLYGTIRETLVRLLGVPCAYTDHLAVPGFHIFTADRLRQMKNLPGHFDRQFWLIPELRQSDETAAVSFTLPIALPASGGGLDYWDSETESGMRSSGPRNIPYRLGVMVVHRGPVLHRIAETPLVEATDERVTLQGHGALHDGAYTLYW